MVIIQYKFIFLSYTCISFTSTPYVYLQTNGVGKSNQIGETTPFNLVLQTKQCQLDNLIFILRDRCDRIVVGFTTSCAIRPYHHYCEFVPCSQRGQVYLIHHFVIKFVGDLQQIGGFLRLLRHYITEISLKVRFNIITITPCIYKHTVCVKQISYRQSDRGDNSIQFGILE